MNKVADLSITSLDVIKAFSLTGIPEFIMDELQDATISQSEETTEITGKGGRRLNTLKRNKAVTISGNNGLLSAGMLEAQTGGTFEQKDSTPVEWTDYLVVKENKATTNYTAAGTVNAEIEALYVRNGDGSAGKELKQAEAVGADQFTYTASTKELAFQGIDDGTEIIVFYTRNVPGHVLVNEADVYSKKLQLYIDATAEDKCGNVFHVQFFIPKADFSGEFELQLGGDQTVHSFEAESLAGGCNVAGGGLWTYTVFGVDADAENP